MKRCVMCDQDTEREVGGFPICDDCLDSPNAFADELKASLDWVENARNADQEQEGEDS